MQLLKDSLKESKGVEKGKKFELFFENFMSQQEGFVFIDKHCRSEVGEIDYFYRTELRNHPLWRKYNYLFIEAKNWEKKISSNEIDHFIILLKAKTVFPCCGIYLTTSPLSPQAKTAMRDARMVNGMMIVAIASHDLPRMIEEGFKNFLERKCDEILAKS
jgi:predicted helicase